MSDLDMISTGEKWDMLGTTNKSTMGVHDMIRRHVKCKTHFFPKSKWIKR